MNPTLLRPPNKYLKRDVRKIFKLRGKEDAMAFIAMLGIADDKGQITTTGDEQLAGILTVFINDNYDLIDKFLKKCLN